MRWRLQRRGQSDRRGGDCARRGRRCGHRGRPRRGSRGVRGSPFRLAPHACGSRHRRRRGRDGPVDAMAACPWSVFHLQVRQRPRDGRCSSRRSPPRTRSQIRNSARASAAVAAALACVDVGGCARGRGNERGKKGGGSRRGKKGRAGGGGGGFSTGEDGGDGCAGLSSSPEPRSTPRCGARPTSAAKRCLRTWGIGQEGPRCAAGTERPRRIMRASACSL